MDTGFNKILSQCDSELVDTFKSIGEGDYNEVNFVTFANYGLKFTARGKYGYISNFNNKSGYHLGFSIEGLELVEKPDDAEYLNEYEDLLFLIELGYFNGKLLDPSENNNGIIVKDIKNLQGKTIQIKQDEGYFACVHTADSDEVAVGEIKFIEWNDKSKVIRFKLLIDYGLCNVVVGTVKLTEDK